MIEHTKEEIQKLTDYCREKLDLSDTQLPDEYGYSNVILCIIDAIFSIGVKYSSTSNTVNRFKQYYSNYADLSVQDFVTINQGNSAEWMAENVYKNRQRTSTKNGILKSEAVAQVAEVLLKYGVDYL